MYIVLNIDVMFNYQFIYAGTYWIFAVVVVIGFLFLFFTLPETKNRRLEELETLFETPWCMCGRSASLDISMKTMQSNN